MTLSALVNPLCAATFICVVSSAQAEPAPPSTLPSMKTPSTCLLAQDQCIVFDGDSLTSRRAKPSLDTWPYLRLMNWDRTYADRMDEWLFCNRPDLGITCHNAAIGGSTASDCLQRYEDSVKPHKPAWVVMTIGTNDRSRKVPVGDFEAVLANYCERLARDSGGRLVVVGGFKPFPFTPDQEAAYQDSLNYTQAIRRALDAHNGLFVDAGTPLFEKAQHLVKRWEGHTVYSDGGHFNEIGSEIIATEVLQALGVVTLAE